MSANFHIRPFASADLPPLVVLMRETLGLPTLDEAKIARDVLLVPGFAPDHLLVAAAGDRPIGFLWAPRHDALAPADTGWLAAFGVDPAHRRRGIASALLDAAIAAMRAGGVSRLDVADVPARYWLPGIDPDAFPLAHAWLTSAPGFAIRDHIASMGVDLANAVDFPADPAIRLCSAGDYPALKAWLTAEFDPGWWGYFERSILARLSGDPTPSEILCAFENGSPIGVVHYRADRFGPLAVTERARGRGLGATLTRAILARMHRAGYASGYFLVAEPAVQPFYTRLGFTILRRFTRLTRRL